MSTWRYATPEELAAHNERAVQEGQCPRRWLWLRDDESDKSLRQYAKVIQFSEGAWSRGMTAERYARDYTTADAVSTRGAQMMIDTERASRYLAFCVLSDPPRRARARDLDRLGRVLAGIDRRQIKARGFRWLREPDWWYRRRVLRELRRPLLRGAR